VEYALRESIAQIESRNLELRERERQLHTLLSNLPGMAYRCRNDRDWTIEFVSEGVEALTGYSALDFTVNARVRYADLIHPCDREAVWREVQACLERREPFLLSYRLRAASGEERWVWDKGRGVFDDSSGLVAIEGFVQDVTERNRSDVRLAAFSRLGQKLSAAETERDAAQIIVDAADQLLPWDACVLSLRCPDKEAMRHLLSYDIIDGRRAPVETGPAECPASPLALRVISEGGQLILKRQPGEPAPGGEPFGDTARPSASIMAVPIRNGVHAVGVFSVQSYTPDAYSWKDLELLQSLADYCGGALQRIHSLLAERETRILLEKAQEVARLGSWSSSLEPDAPLVWSREVYRIFGLEPVPGPIKVRDFYDRVHPDDRQAVRAASRAALEQGVPYDLDHRILRPNGTVVWVHEKAELIRDQTGRPLRMLGVVQDITDRKRAEEALRGSELRWRTLFECCPDACYLNDLQGRLLAGNRAAEEMVGYRREELLGKSFLELNLLDDQGLALARVLVARNAKGDGTGPDTIRLRRKDGVWITAEICSFPIQLNGQVVVMAVARDITQRVKAEARLKASEERYRRLFESVNDGVLVRPVPRGEEPEPNFIEVNDVLCERLGFSREEMLAKSPRDIDPHTDLKKLRAVAKQARHREGAIFETVHIARDGRRIPVEISTRLCEWEGRDVMLSVVRDLRERKAAEAILRESERRFRQMLENVRLFAVMLDEAGRIVFINSFLLRTTGYDLEDVMGRSWFEVFIPSDQAPRVKRVFDELLQGKPLYNYENDVLTRPGERRLVLWSNTTMRDPGGRIVGVTSIGEDVTERRAAERALMASEEQFRTVVENGPLGIIIQTDGRFAYLNGQAVRLFGATSPGDLLGQPIIERFHPEFRAEVLERTRIVTEERRPVPTGERKCLRLDGSCFEIESAVVPFVYRGRNSGLVFFQDITERKRLERQLRQAQKMEAVGQLAGGVAHDFNNILAAVLMNLGLLRHRHQLPPEAVESLDELEKETLRATSLTRQLLLFSRHDVAEIKPVDLNTTLPNILKMLRRLLGENVQLTFAPAAEPARVAADVGMIEQVVMNLCINARDAMPKGGQVVLALSTAELGPEVTQGKPEARPGRFVCLSVSDSGCGMDATVLSRIFEPFFTTKEAGKGTGLGLATVYGIVKQHQGWVDVESQPGRGSTFQAYFPALDGGTTLAVSTPASEEARGGSEAILLVEDELSVRRIAALCLRKLGYAVHEAPNATQALEVWREHGRNISLLLSDMVLPEARNGLELAQLLRRDNPGLKVIITSGYNPETSGIHSHAGSPVTFLAKPFKASTLALTVRNCLDGQPSEDLP
jgi:PAS domain S-box-containing protein